MRFLGSSLNTEYKVRLYPNYWDLLALIIVLAIITLFTWNARQMSIPYELGQDIPISLDPHLLPFYALRTVSRMLIALFFSLLFTFIFGTWAAKSRRAGRFIIPIIDVLQSVPILGFLSVAITAFIRLFPGTLLGPECATIFVIFTSQAWNMALGFYQTIRSVPAEVKEAARMLQLSAWQRFWRIDVPFSLPSLLWNSMASMSAGWFFVVFSEAITVSNQQILLPGIGSYIAVAVQAANLWAITYAVFAMFIVIIIYDQLLFRPLVAWAEKFKSEKEGGVETVAESWVVDLFRRTRAFRQIGYLFSSLFDRFVNIPAFRKKANKHTFLQTFENIKIERIKSLLWACLTSLCGICAFIILVNHIRYDISLAEMFHVFTLGLITAFRVFVMIALCSVIWVPVGLWIGLRPRAAQIAQPIAQILSAFPANLFYPFIVMFIVYYHLSPNIWLTPLMILGSQWYILFNVVAGASTLPKDLLQAADNLSVQGWLRFKKLLLPGVFPYYVTGAITAAGGAWNASIASEVVNWGDEKLIASGLGAYITEHTIRGDFSRIALGIGMMCILVLIFNRLVWRPLYIYAENRFLLE